MLSFASSIHQKGGSSTISGLGIMLDDRTNLIKPFSQHCHIQFLSASSLKRKQKDITNYPTKYHFPLPQQRSLRGQKLIRQHDVSHGSQCWYISHALTATTVCKWSFFLGPFLYNSLADTRITHSEAKDLAPCFDRCELLPAFSQIVEGKTSHISIEA